VKAARCASKVAEVPIEQQGRRSGYSKYNLLKLFCLFLEFVIHHSRHIFGRIIIFGVGLLLSSLVAGGIYLFLRILQTIPSSPVFQAIIILMFFTGWQTLIIGFVGEYLRRLYRLFEGNFSSYRVQEVIKIK
jgi:dolichol-phosphate mannosyltransferase